MSFAENESQEKEISIDALILAGLLQCHGTNLQKARGFALIVQPEFDD